MKTKEQIENRLRKLEFDNNEHGCAKLTKRKIDYWRCMTSLYAPQLIGKHISSFSYFEYVQIGYYIPPNANWQYSVYAICCADTIGITRIVVSRFDEIVGM